MPNPERTGQRDGVSQYSERHRSLPDRCYFVDVDGLEWRADRGVVALFEIIRRRRVPGVNPEGRLNRAFWTATEQAAAFKCKIISEMADRLGCASYLVAHSDDFDEFWVRDLKDGDVHRMTLGEYADFLSSL